MAILNVLVPVRITIPARPNNPNSQPMKVTVQVPGHALQQGSNSGEMLQQVLTQAITMVLAFPQEEEEVVARYLQQQINSAYRLAWFFTESSTKFDAVCEHDKFDDPLAELFYRLYINPINNFLQNSVIHPLFVILYALFQKKK